MWWRLLKATPKIMLYPIEELPAKYDMRELPVELEKTETGDFIIKYNKESPYYDSFRRAVLKL
tara:strand:+ start:296 stop:484 length:189 start_codon:yes stop_codon:yes gene_type:complete